MHTSFLSQALYDEFYLDEYTDYDDFMLGLMNYFPVDKIDINLGSYDQYLYDLQKTVADNYKNGNYQVSFFYSHLIFMSYVYYCVEKAYLLFPERMRDIYYPMNVYSGRKDKPDIDNYASVYDFSKFPEKEIFKIFHIIGMDDDTIKRLAKYISDRDDYAHATGKGNISDETLKGDIKTVYANMEAVHDAFCVILKQMYVDLLLKQCEETYINAIVAISEFIIDNSLSIEDIYYICNMEISGIRDENEEFKTQYRHIKKVHCAFIDYCIENYEIEHPENFSTLKDNAYIHYKYEDNASDYIEEELCINAYRCEKDGGTYPLYECPECDEEQLVHDAENGKFHCFHCDTDYESNELMFCSGCGNVAIKTEVDLCKNCIDAKMKE